MADSPLSTAHKEALRSCRVLLEDNLDVDYILAKCLQDNVISSRMKAKIEARITPHEKCGTFLDILQTRGKQAFNDFVAALKEDHAFLARSLEKELRVKALSLVNASLVSANEIIDENDKSNEEERERTKASVENIQTFTDQLRTTIGIPRSAVTKVRSNVKTNSPSPLSDAHKATIRSQRVLLQESLDVQHIIPRCIQDGVLTREMRETITAQPTRHQKCSAFLDILETRDTQAFESFVSSLHADYTYLELPLKRELRSQAVSIVTDALTDANVIFCCEIPSNERQSTEAALESIETLVSQLKVTLGIQDISDETATAVYAEKRSPTMAAPSVSVKSIIAKMSAMETPSSASSDLSRSSLTISPVSKQTPQSVKPPVPTFDDSHTSKQRSIPPVSSNQQTELTSQASPGNVTTQLSTTDDSRPASQDPPPTGPSLVVKSPSAMSQSSTSHESAPSTSLVKQLKTLKLSPGHLSVTLARKVELPYSCYGLCSSSIGDIITSIDKHGIYVYNKDYTFKLKFALKGHSDVVCLPTDEIVVSSLPNNWVKVFDMEGNYTRQICKDVNQPFGLAFHPQLGIVVIGKDPECLNICSISGEVLRTIRNTSFKDLQRVVINPYNKTLLVTDFTADTLHCLDWEGVELFTFTGDDNSLRGPIGIYVTNQYLLLVDGDNHRVLLLSHDGHLLKVLLTKEDGLKFPSVVMVDSSGNIVVGESHGAVTRKNLLYVFKVN